MRVGSVQTIARRYVVFRIEIEPAQIATSQSVNRPEKLSLSHSRASVAIPSDFGQEGGRDLSCLQFIPVHLSEPWMGEDIACTVSEITKSLCRVALHELPYEIRRLLVEGGRPSNERRATRDFLVEKNRIDFGLVIWWKTRQHLEYEHTEGIPINRLVVPLLPDDLKIQINNA